MAQLRDERELAGARGVEGLLEDPDRAARPLGVVHRLVGPLQQHAGRRAVLGGEGDAEAPRHVDLDAAELDRGVESGVQPLGQPDGGGGVGASVGDDPELVAAEPGHDGGGAEGRGQPRGDLAQQAVAVRVPEGVVDVLEGVEVEDPHREPRWPGGGRAVPRSPAGAGPGWAARSEGRAGRRGAAGRPARRCAARPRPGWRRSRARARRRARSRARRRAGPRRRAGRSCRPRRAAGRGCCRAGRAARATRAAPGRASRAARRAARPPDTTPAASWSPSAPVGRRLLAHALVAVQAAPGPPRRRPRARTPPGRARRAGSRGRACRTPNSTPSTPGARKATWLNR